MTDKQRLYEALIAIVGHVDSHRPRGFHMYPTHLRDKAIRALEDTGYRVKTYEEYERETDKWLDEQAKRGGKE